MIKILLVEDQKLMRIGIKSLFNDYPEMEVIGEALNGKEAIEKAKLIKPDIILMDIGLPDISGIEATKQILENNNNIKVIILTSHIDENELNASLTAGANAYVIKDISTEYLMYVIKMVRDGAMWIDPKVVPFIRDKNSPTEMQSAVRVIVFVSIFTYHPFLELYFTRKNFVFVLINSLT